MPCICVDKEDINIECNIRRSLNAINPEYKKAETMSCTLKNWNGKSPFGSGIGIGFPSDSFLDQLAKKQVNVNSSGCPELVLSPILPLTNSQSNSALAEGIHQRFHSFGGIPLEGTTIPDSLKQRSISLGSPNNPPNREKKLNKSDSDLKKSNKSNGVVKNLNKSDSDVMTTRKSTMKEENMGVPLTHDSITIPISDIIMIDTDGSYSCSHGNSSAFPQDVIETHLMYITTLNKGYFEFTFHSRNAHDVMVAFLQSTLPDERITRNNNYLRQYGGHDHDMSYDMEFVTAREMKNCEKESFSEKLMTRMQVVFSFIDGFSDHCCSSGAQEKVPSPLEFVTSKEALEVSLQRSYSQTSRNADFVFSYEDNDRDSAPVNEKENHISLTVVNNDNESCGSSFSRDKKIKKKNTIPPSFNV